MNKLVMYYRFAKDEILKVIFPTKYQVRSAFVSVCIVVAIITTILALFDILLSAIISSVL